MSDGWSRHTWRNEWNPIASIRPEVGQLVEVWAFTDSIPAIYHADGQFRTRDGQQIGHITHWRSGPSETDTLLLPSQGGEEGPGEGSHARN